jgi:HlyD family secretion protein
MPRRFASTASPLADEAASKGPEPMRWLKRILLLVVLVAAVAAVVYARVLRPIPVTASTARHADLVVEVMGTGTVQARVSAVMSPKIEGRLIDLSVDQGDLVTSDTTIARLDDADLTRQVEIAQANVQAALASLDRRKAELARATAVLRHAKRDDERIHLSFEQGASNESELDKSQEQVAISQADLASANAGIAEGQKLVIVAEKTLEYHQARLEETILTAPFDGLIVHRDRDPGDIVVPGSAIYTLIDLDEIWVSAWVDETAMASLAPNQPARVVLRSEPDHPYRGHVVRLGRETDPETREFIVDVAIEQLPQNWAIGQRGEVYIETQRLEQALVIDLTFIATIEAHRGVFVEHNGRAVWTPCTFGARGRKTIQVLEGLEPGQTLVRLANPGARVQLTDGKRITIP